MFTAWPIMLHRYTWLHYSMFRLPLQLTLIVAVWNTKYIPFNTSNTANQRAFIEVGPSAACHSSLHPLSEPASKGVCLWIIHYTLDWSSPVCIYCQQQVTYTRAHNTAGKIVIDFGHVYRSMYCTFGSSWTTTAQQPWQNPTRTYSSVLPS